MTPEYSNNPLYACWPFWMLELDPSADNRSIEKAYAKITSALNLQIPNAEHYLSPLGMQTRDEFQLRDAKSILLDPERRLLAEFWYLPPTTIIEQNKSASEKVDADVDWKKMLGTM